MHILGQRIDYIHSVRFPGSHWSPNSSQLKITRPNFTCKTFED